MFVDFRGVWDVIGCWVSINASPLGNAFDVCREVISGSSVDNSELSESVVFKECLSYASQCGR